MKNKDVAMKKALAELAEGKYDPSMSKDYDEKMDSFIKKKKKKMKKPFPQKDLDDAMEYGENEGGQTVGKHKVKKVR